MRQSDALFCPLCSGGVALFLSLPVTAGGNGGSGGVFLAYENMGEGGEGGLGSVNHFPPALFF